MREVTEREAEDQRNARSLQYPGVPSPVTPMPPSFSSQSCQARKPSHSTASQVPALTLLLPASRTDGLLGRGGERFKSHWSAF